MMTSAGCLCGRVEGGVDRLLLLGRCGSARGRRWSAAQWYGRLVQLPRRLRLIGGTQMLNGLLFKKYNT
jgi:hypothetical protein